MLDMIDDGHVRIAGHDEVAVHRMHVEVLSYCVLARGKALRNDTAAVDASCSWRMP